MKDLEIRLVSELMKNSRRSDRQIAKELGVSQPTVSRTIAKLERQGVLREYTAIPDFRKLGYNLVAITLGNVREELKRRDRIDGERRKFVRDFDDASLEIVLDVRGLGMGHDGTMVSFHRSYSDYDAFRKRLMQMPFVDPATFETFLVDLNDEAHHRLLTFSYLAKHVLQDAKNKNSV